MFAFVYSRWVAMIILVVLGSWLLCIIHRELPQLQLEQMDVCGHWIGQSFEE